LYFFRLLGLIRDTLKGCNYMVEDTRNNDEPESLVSFCFAMYPRSLFLDYNLHRKTALLIIREDKRYLSIDNNTPEQEIIDFVKGVICPP
jgi:hypothetical protein